MNYWVYENWVAERKAVIHVADCGHCKDGRGCHPNPHGNANGRWIGPFKSMSQAKLAAKGTGKPVRSHSCCGKKVTLSVLVASAVLTGCSPAPEPTMLERYPGPWAAAFNAPITKALAINRVSGCGQYQYRESSRNKGEYLVYCSADGKFWTAYIVWIPSEKIMGPYQPDPTIPPR